MNRYTSLTITCGALYILNLIISGFIPFPWWLFNMLLAIPLGFLTGYFFSRGRRA